MEARYKGKEKWYKATVQKVRSGRSGRPGTYDLTYEDGDKEKNVARELIRTLKPEGGGKKTKEKKKKQSGSRSGSSSSSDSGSDASDGTSEFEEGAEVEARY